ncbi:MAG: hypothetical protein IJP26_00790 [Clostridia bacterium]|nr:hypothetical protein [Clostridia bacterium]
MDIFSEQLVSIKKDAKTYFLAALIIVATAAITAGALIYSGAYPILVMVAVAAVYGAVKLIGLLNIEYEYILTNGTFDIDKITSKSKRSRVLSFECADILNVGKYNENAIKSMSVAKKLICGNPANAYFIVAKVKGQKVLMVLSLNEKMLNTLKNSVPKAQAQQLFFGL